MIFILYNENTCHSEKKNIFFLIYKMVYESRCWNIFSYELLFIQFIRLRVKTVTNY